MTWTGHCRITDVNGNTATAIAVAGELVQPWAAMGDDREVGAVASNTEGRITRVALTLDFESEAPVQVGDFLTVSGHFTVPDRGPTG